MYTRHVRVINSGWIHLMRVLSKDILSSVRANKEAYIMCANVAYNQQLFVQLEMFFFFRGGISPIFHAYL